MFRTSPTRLLSNAVSSARCMHNLFRPLGLAEFGRILSELQPRRVQDGRFLNVYNYGRGWNPREITGKACRTLLRRKAAATSGTRPQARRVDGLLSRLAPWALLDREFFSRMQRLAFERGCRRAILGKPSIVLADRSAGGLACRILGTKPVRPSSLVEA
jgi:hypothetical protein